MVHSAEVVALVEVLEVEVVRGGSAPQPEGIDRLATVANHWHVVGDAPHCLGRSPEHRVASVLHVVAHLAAKGHADAALGPGDFPRVAAAQPAVRVLDLVPVLDALLENAVLVAEAVADRRHAQCGHGFEEARRQTTEPAIAEACVHLLLADVLEIEADGGEGGVDRIQHVQVQHIVPQTAPHEELQRQVVDALHLGLVELVLAADPAVNQPVSDRPCQGEELVVRAGREAIDGQVVVEMVPEGAQHGFWVRAGAVNAAGTGRRRLGLWVGAHGHTYPMVVANTTSSRTLLPPTGSQ